MGQAREREAAAAAASLKAERDETMRLLQSARLAVARWGETAVRRDTAHDTRHKRARWGETAVRACVKLGWPKPNSQWAGRGPAGPSSLWALWPAAGARGALSPLPAGRVLTRDHTMCPVHACV